MDKKPRKLGAFVVWGGEKTLIFLFFPKTLVIFRIL